LGTADQPVANPSPQQLEAIAAKLVAEVFDDPWGLAGPSCYDTAHFLRAWARRPGRIPGRIGRAALASLLRRQNPDGSWGGHQSTPRHYHLVDTLAATVALLAANERGDQFGLAGKAAEALRHGLAYLTQGMYLYDPAALPELMGIRYILPDLLEQLIGGLADRAATECTSGVSMSPVRGSQQAFFEQALALHSSWHDGLRAARRAVGQGSPLPTHLDGLSEVFDGTGVLLREVGALGVGCSPSATAAALAIAPTVPPGATEYLDIAMARNGDAAPTLMPIEIYERLWTLMPLLRTGTPLSVARRRRVIATLNDYVTPQGVSMGTAWETDGDDTAAALFILHQLGVNRTPESLLTFEREDAFVAYSSGVYTASPESKIGARSLSVSLNSHVLEALESDRRCRPDQALFLEAPMGKARRFILDSQHADGGWGIDKWHSSPYYPASCAILALHYSSAGDSLAAIRRGINWLLEHQRVDGSWGQWLGTLEESAHAMLALCFAGATDPSPARVTSAIECGARFLDEAWAADPDDGVRIPLWHGKVLYQLRGHFAYPIAARQAAYLVARHGLAPLPTDHHASW
jgi:hypothetical protein